MADDPNLYLPGGQGLIRFPEQVLVYLRGDEARADSYRGAAAQLKEELDRINVQALNQLKLSRLFNDGTLIEVDKKYNFYRITITCQIRAEGKETTSDEAEKKPKANDFGDCLVFYRKKDSVHVATSYMNGEKFTVVSQHKAEELGFFDIDDYVSCYSKKVVINGRDVYVLILPFKFGDTKNIFSARKYFSGLERTFIDPFSCILKCEKPNDELTKYYVYIYDVKSKMFCRIDDEFSHPFTDTLINNSQDKIYIYKPSYSTGSRYIAHNLITVSLSFDESNMTLTSAVSRTNIDYLSRTPAVGLDSAGSLYFLKNRLEYTINIDISLHWKYEVYDGFFVRKTYGTDNAIPTNLYSGSLASGICKISRLPLSNDPCLLMQINAYAGILYIPIYNKKINTSDGETVEVTDDNWPIGDDISTIVKLDLDGTINTSEDFGQTATASWVYPYASFFKNKEHVESEIKNNSYEITYGSGEVDDVQKGSVPISGAFTANYEVATGWALDAYGSGSFPFPINFPQSVEDDLYYYSVLDLSFSYKYPENLNVRHDISVEKSFRMVTPYETISFSESLRPIGITHIQSDNNELVVQAIVLCGIDEFEKEVCTNIVIYNGQNRIEEAIASAFGISKQDILGIVYVPGLKEMAADCLTKP